MLAITATKSGHPCKFWYLFGYKSVRCRQRLALLSNRLKTVTRPSRHAWAENMMFWATSIDLSFPSTRKLTELNRGHTVVGMALRSKMVRLATLTRCFRRKFSSVCQEIVVANLLNFSFESKIRIDDVFRMSGFRRHPSRIRTALETLTRSKIESMKLLLPSYSVP